MKKKTEIKSKLINHIMINGKKSNSEKILIKSVKELQKYSKKQSKRIIQLAIINATPIFKLHKIKNKKQKKRKKKSIREIPVFIANTSARTSLALKFLLATISKKKSMKFNTKLRLELLLAAKSQGSSVEFKNELQKQVLLKQHFFNKYRWK